MQNKSTTDTECLEHVEVYQFHYPLVSFLTDDPDIGNFEKETRIFPVCTPFSSIRVAMQRTDMRERTIDCVEGKGHSFLRCISKEIFGNEKNIDVLKEILIKEFKDNVKIYCQFIGEEIKRSCKAWVGIVENNTGGYKKLSQFIKVRIEEDLPCDELLLWLACTYFQTPIYVLRITDSDTSTLTSWAKYKKQRRRERDQKKKTSFLKKCLESRKYFICLLETEGKQYCRIVPKLKSCNCFLEKPSIPSVESAQCHTQQGSCLLAYRVNRIMISY